MITMQVTLVASAVTISPVGESSQIARTETLSQEAMRSVAAVVLPMLGDSAMLNERTALKTAPGG